MAIDPFTAMLAGSVLQAGAGIYGSNQAANAQEDATKQAADMRRRELLIQLGITEPQRAVGHQALGDLAHLYGYSVPEYTPANQLAAAATPISSKAVKKLLKSGVSPEQIQAMGGTLGTLKPKTIKRLTRAGLTPEQIQSLTAGSAATGISQGANKLDPRNPVATDAGAGAETGGPAAPGNMDRFFTSPDYQFRLSESTKAIDRSAAARSGPTGGNVIKANTDYAGNLAAGEYGNYVNRLLQIAGLGQAANAQAGNATSIAGNGLANAATAAGDARASGILGGTNSVVNAVNSGVNNYAMLRYVNAAGAAPAPAPTAPPAAVRQPGPWASGYVFP